MELTDIKLLFQDLSKYEGKKVTVGGWIRSIRDSKAIGFIVMNDGTCFNPLQIVYTDQLNNFAEVSKLNVGSAIVATGTIVATPDAKQAFEMQAEDDPVQQQPRAARRGAGPGRRAGQRQGLCRRARRGQRGADPRG